jgi:hypothetical protein
MTHHSFALVTIKFVLGVTGRKGAKARGGSDPKNDPPKRQANGALRRLQKMKVGRYDLRDVKVDSYTRLPAKDPRRRSNRRSK